jgi:hypothetical protein
MIGCISKRWPKPEKGEADMAAEGEVRASHEEVEGFVAKLRNFHGSLEGSERAMLETILESARGGDTGGYIKIRRRYGDPEGESTEQEASSGWNDLIGWIEEQGDEDTQGFIKIRR